MNQLPDGEYEDVVGLLGSGGKLPKWLELIVWQRGKQPYPAAEEKVHFEGYDLNSLRVVASKKLESAIAVLRSGLPAEIEALAENLDGLPRRELLLALDFIKGAKTHAIKRCYLERLVKLIDLESAIVAGAYSGIKRTAALGTCATEMEQARANLLLVQQINYYRTEFLDKVIATRNKTGALELERIKDYLLSDFAKLDVSAYPALLRSEKLLLDEVFHALNGDRKSACRIAESVWESDQQSHFLSPLSRAKLMVRLNDNYAALGYRAKGEKLVAQFAAFDPELPQNRAIYLVRFLIASLEWRSEGASKMPLDSVVELFQRNEDFFLGLPVSGNRSLILIAMMAIYLGQQDIEKAKMLFNNLYREKDQKPSLRYRISGLLCHLMILFDSHEVAELKHHAKNYRELMMEKGDFSIPAIRFLSFLQINARRYATSRPSLKVSKAYQADLEAIIISLQRYQLDDGVAERLLYEPFINWLNAKLS
ncbi:MAG: hypothetical protein U0176_06020 [Bacteroidia bacterium]